MLKDLFISKTRVKLLEIFLSDSTQMYHVRDLVRKTAEEIKREQAINYTPMTVEELKFRRTRHDPFLNSILIGSRVMVIGDEEDLVG